jgi:hypothetical protein
MLPLPRATPVGVLTSPLMANKKRRGETMNKDQALLEPVGRAERQSEVQGAEGGEAELRKDSMMAHLLDSLKAASGSSDAG